MAIYTTHYLLSYYGYLHYSLLAILLWLFTLLTTCYPTIAVYTTHYLLSYYGCLHYSLLAILLPNAGFAFALGFQPYRLHGPLAPIPRPDQFQEPFSDVPSSIKQFYSGRVYPALTDSLLLYLLFSPRL